MESDVLDSASFYRLWAWLETRRKQVLIGVVAATVCGFAVGFYFWHRSDTENKASEALSDIIFQGFMAGGRGTMPDTYLKLAAEYPNTSGAARAQLLAAKSLFEENKFPEAQAQFQNFLREHPDSPFSATGLLGVASCMEAQGKTNEAITAYDRLVQNHPSDAAALQAKLALADLYDAQGKWEQAKKLYDEIFRANQRNSIGMEAAMRSAELTTEHQPPATVVPPSTNSPQLLKIQQP